MLNNPTVEKLKGMKLKVMAQVLIDQDPALRELSFEERLKDSSIRPLWP